MTPQSNERRGVERLYQFGSARWYETFRAIWTRLTSRAAEAELDQILRENAVDGCHVLDIGCGTGHNLGRLLRLEIPFSSYRGVDLTDAMLNIAREHFRAEARARFEQADLYRLAGSVERYDLILCTWVASHLEQPRDVFEIAYGLLAPEGRALFLTLTRPRWYILWWFSPFVRLFQARYLRAEVLHDLPGLVAQSSWTARLTTLVHLRKPRESEMKGLEAEDAQNKVHVDG